jgi:hypothetical protein
LTHKKVQINQSTPNETELRFKATEARRSTKVFGQKSSKKAHAHRSEQEMEKKNKTRQKKSSALRKHRVALRNVFKSSEKPHCGHENLEKTNQFKTIDALKMTSTQTSQSKTKKTKNQVHIEHNGTLD